MNLEIFILKLGYNVEITWNIMFAAFYRHLFMKFVLAFDLNSVVKSFNISFVANRQNFD